jgi:hypothetical protein
MIDIGMQSTWTNPARALTLSHIQHILLVKLCLPLAVVLQQCRQPLAYVEPFPSSFDVLNSLASSQQSVTLCMFQFTDASILLLLLLFALHVGCNLLDPQFLGVYNGNTKHAADMDAVLSRAALAGVEVSSCLRSLY